MYSPEEVRLEGERTGFVFGFVAATAAAALGYGIAVLWMSR